MKHCLTITLTILLAMLTLGACKPSLPRKVLPEGKMENILYDYQLAQSMASMEPDRVVRMEAYKRNILAKYGITEEELDSSFSYYMRHTEKLKTMYEKVGDRLDNEAQALGASSSERSKYAGLSTTGDTADVWTARRSMVLLPHPPYNQSNYTIAADTSYRAGDQLRLEFDCDFFYQDGVRSACTVMAIKYQNDSVASTTYQLSSSSHYSMTVSDAQRKGIKEIKGYFVLGKPQGDMDSRSTLQLLVVRGIHLVRMHTKEEKSVVERPVAVPGPNNKETKMPDAPALSPVAERPATLPPPHTSAPPRPVADKSKRARVTQVAK